MNMSSLLKYYQRVSPDMCPPHKLKKDAGVDAASIETLFSCIGGKLFPDTPQFRGDSIAVKTGHF